MKIRAISLAMFLVIIICGTLLTACTKTGEAEIDTKDMLTVKMSDNSDLASSDDEPKYVEPEYTLNDAEKEIADAAAEYMEQLDFSGSVLLGVEGHIIYRDAFGYADKKAKTDNTNESVYQIASLTKQFTAAAIMQLQEQGKLKVTDKLTKYFSDFDHADELTIENLLFMASGMQDFAEAYILNSIDEKKQYPVGTIFDMVKDYQLWSTPGMTYEYCNTNYYMLGMIIEKVSGMTYEEYLQKNIFDPLYMYNTNFDSSKTTSKGYSWGNEHTCVYDKSIFYASGSICSTTEDMFRWLRGFNDEKVVNKDSLEYIRSNHGNELGYSCGWTVVDEGLQRHSGNLSGYKTFDMIKYDHNITVVVLSNNEQQESRYIGTELVNIASNHLD